MAKAQARFSTMLTSSKSGQQISIHQYHRYLSMQYHLTKGVQRYFIAAAGHPDLSRMKSLRKFLLDFANEEEKHYLVAAQDLARMDLPVLPPPFDVELWHAFFGTTVVERPFLRLGAACVLENISGGAAKPAIHASLSASFLNKSNTQFLTLHQHEARPHGDEILDALRAVNLPNHAISDLEEGARKGLVMYLRMAEWALVPTCDAAYADARSFQMTPSDSDQISKFSMEELAS